jgi:hypothetical protein
VQKSGFAGESINIPSTPRSNRKRCFISRANDPRLRFCVRRSDYGLWQSHAVRSKWRKKCVSTTRARVSRHLFSARAQKPPPAQPPVSSVVGRACWCKQNRCAASQILKWSVPSSKSNLIRTKLREKC